MEFNSSVFNSYDSLRTFLKGEEAIQEILSQKNPIYPQLLKPLHASLPGHWKVCQWVTFPPRFIFSRIFALCASLLKWSGFSLTSKKIKLLSKGLNIGFYLISEDPTKILKIRSSQNAPNSSGDLVNQHPPISLSEIPDYRVRKKSHLSKPISFDFDGGICRGMVEWFFYLYFQTKDQFQDPRHHMSVLSKQFSHGGGKEAVVLQAINIKKGKVLGLQIGKQPCSHPIAPRWWSTELTIPDSIWKNSNAAPTIIEQFQAFAPNTAYEIWVPRHAIAYIKIHDRLGFFFDPNYGVFEINGIDQGKKLYSLIAAAYNATGGDKGIESSSFGVLLTPVCPRSSAG